MTKSNYVAYLAILDDSENQPNEFTVTFPDVPGAISEGNGITQAISNGAEALGLILFDEENLPTPSSYEKIARDYPNAIISYIMVDLVAAKKKIHVPLVRKNTTIPADLAELAEENGLNFSAILTEALKEKLNI